jgi:plastocyanin
VRRKTLVAGAALAVLALAPAAISEAGSDKPVRKTIKVGDFYFAPERLSVPVNSRVQWKWPSVPGDLHDVKLTRTPKGVKRFQSQLAASDYKYPRKPKKLTVPGRYVVICTLHPQMTTTIRVRR